MQSVRFSLPEKIKDHLALLWMSGFFQDLRGQLLAVDCLLLLVRHPHFDDSLRL